MLVSHSRFDAGAYVGSGNARLEPGSNRAFLTLLSLQHHNIIVNLPHTHTTTTQPHTLTASQPNTHTTTIQPYSLTTSQPHNLTPTQQPHSLTPSQPHNLTPTQQPHSLTPSQPHNLTPTQQPHSHTGSVPTPPQGTVGCNVTVQWSPCPGSEGVSSIRTVSSSPTLSTSTILPSSPFCLSHLPQIRLSENLCKG